MKLKQSLKEYHVLIDANQLVLNCKRLSYFWPFTYGMITQNTSHRSIMYLYRCHSASTSLEKGERVDEESNKNDIELRAAKNWFPSPKLFYSRFSVTQSFLLGFSWPIIVSEIITSYLHKNIKIPLLCQCRLFRHTCVYKFSCV